MPACAQRRLEELGCCARVHWFCASRRGLACSCVPLSEPPGTWPVGRWNGCVVFAIGLENVLALVGVTIRCTHRAIEVIDTVDDRHFYLADGAQGFVRDRDPAKEVSDG